MISILPRGKRHIYSELIFLLLIFITLFFFYISYNRRSFSRYRGKLPLIIFPEFKKKLSTYLETLPSRSVLLLNGTRQSGKSRTIDHFAELFTKKGRLVITLDPKMAPSISGFISQLNSSIIQSLVNVKSYVSNEVFENFLFDQNFSHYGVHPSFSDPFSLLIRSVSLLIVNNQIGSVRVLSFFDTLNSFKDTLRPLIFVHNADFLHEKIFDSLREVLKTYFRQRDLYEQYVPIVAEIHNFSLFNADYFHVLTLPELDTKSLETFVNKRVFNYAEVNKIQKEFGGNGGKFSSVYELLKNNLKIDSALELIKNQVNSFF